jgi:radical SAM superfamily enzyme YgiQ (UPF0313 family)
MRILLISANRESFPEPVFPVGLGYISQALLSSGAEVMIFDMRHCFPFLKLKKVLKAFRPEAVGISLRNIDNAAYPCVRFYIPYYLSLVKAIRCVSKASIILGGSGFSLFPKEIIELLHADAGVTGEGERSMLRILGCNGKKISTGEFCNPDDISVPENIDEIFPFFKKYRTIGVQTARGCRNMCIYCTYPVLEGRRHRRRQPGIVADEISMYYKKYGKRNFFLVDSILNSDEGHMTQVLEKIAGMHLPIRLSIYLQPKITDVSIFRLLKKAGCVAVEFGTDSGSHSMLASMKKSFTVEDISKASRACRNAGIDYSHSLIFGGPGETRETIMESVRLMDETSPRAIIAMTGIRIYPGTEIELLAQKEDPLTPRQSLLTPRFYFGAMGRTLLIEETYKAVAQRKNWFFPGQKYWSSTIGYRILNYVYRGGPLWRTFSSTGT